MKFVFVFTKVQYKQSYYLLEMEREKNMTYYHFINKQGKPFNMNTFQVEL